MVLNLNLDIFLWKVSLEMVFELNPELSPTNVKAVSQERPPSRVCFLIVLYSVVKMMLSE